MGCNVNRNVKQLLQLCKSLGLFIPSDGRTDDSLGRFAYCSPLSSSVVAYAVTDPSHINYSTVRPQILFSDHSHVTLSLKKNNHPETSSETGKQTLSFSNSSSVSVSMRLNLKADTQIENIIYTFLYFKTSTGKIIYILQCIVRQGGLTRDSHGTA